MSEFRAAGEVTDAAKRIQAGSETHTLKRDIVRATKAINTNGFNNSEYSCARQHVRVDSSEAKHKYLFSTTLPLPVFHTDSLVTFPASEERRT